jgi:hypothetical protein
MNDYKAAAERTDEAERLLKSAIRRGAKSSDDAKRDRFVRQLIEAKAKPKHVNIFTAIARRWRKPGKSAARN